MVSLTPISVEPMDTKPKRRKAESTIHLNPIGSVNPNATAKIARAVMLLSGACSAFVSQVTVPWVVPEY